MGRHDLGDRGAILLCGVLAAVIVGLQPRGVSAQPDAAEPPAAPARVEPPAPPQLAVPPDSPPRRPWREAMERAPAARNDAADMERVWYGWQTLLVDLSGVGLLGLSVAANEEMLAVAALVVIGLGSPVVHLAHDKGSAAVISFAIRATSIGLLFLGGLLISEGLFDEDDGTFDRTSESIGVVAAIASIPGALTAIIIDASLLAFDLRPRVQQRASLTPWIDTRHGSYGVRLVLSM